ncbi:MAG: hypothetical protein KJ063_06195 [Anaerolineae bacterium]|nr:hypothetical protein [Anaerolineae bacterium]
MRKEIELMRVLRVPPLGKIVVEMGDNRYLNLNEIPQAEAKRRILAAIGDLVVFAGGYQKLVDADVAAPLAAAERAPAPPLAQTRDLAPSPPQAAAVEKPSAPAVKTSITGPLSDSPSPTMISIAAQIDEILQQHLQADPVLARRNIHLRQSAAGGLIIEVDGHAYKRPNEIDDPHVREVIKRALKEWERS